MKTHQWFLITVTLTQRGAEKVRMDSISNLGSDQGLEGFGSLLAKKHARQAASPQEFARHEFKVRGDDVSRVLGEVNKMIGVGGQHIANISITEDI